MYARLLTFLRCPGCGGELQLEALAQATNDPDDVTQGLLHCPQGHWYPVVGGVPRMLPDAINEHWGSLRALVTSSASSEVGALAQRMGGSQPGSYDHRTRVNYSQEWEYHEIGDRTWGMELADRVKWFFLQPIGIPRDELEGKVLLDAGCGNGSQSVAYTELGVEVIAVDLSSGLELGHAFRHRHPGARPDRVHFVQADLRSPPIAPGSVDIIHSAGVLQATPSTEETFRRLVPLLRPGGTFYVWVLSAERFVTPVVESIRAVTTRLPPGVFARLAPAMAPAFQAFSRATNRVGLRAYPVMTRREAVVALFDVFGSPYAHHHSYDELAGWFRDAGFEEVWPCNVSRRGLGACGRTPAATPGKAGADLSGTASRASAPA